MSFTNLTPDMNPDGSRFPGGMSFGIRYFYFTFVPTTPSVDVFLSRNMFRNEESITRLLLAQSPVSLLTPQNVSNVIFPCVFINSQITINTPSGLTYKNTRTTPDFKINNLTIGTTYILETRTIYNDPGMDFSGYIKGLSLTYIKTSTVPIVPTLPIPLPIPPPPVPPVPTTGAPPTPTNLVATSGICGVSLTWNPVQSTVPVSQYLIYREGFLLSSSSTPTYMDSQVISGNPYTYTVSALNTIGESGKSLPRTITPTFSFTCLIPNKTPIGAMIAESNIRYYYFLFTPITQSIDVLCYNGESSTLKAIIGLYDTTDPTTNYFVASNLNNLNSNVSFGQKTLGPLIVDGLTAVSNTGTFSINLPPSDLTTPSASIKSYILEIAAYTPNVFMSDFGANITSAQLTYNSVSLVRGLPSPYVISYDFTGTSESNYTEFIYPNMPVFQNVKTVLESIITISHKARGFNRTNDMLVHFTINLLTGDSLGESSLDEWTRDSTRSPDFPYEQTITFNSKYFTNGYMTNRANFNGASRVNTIPNINLFNVLIHEMIHGLGFFFKSSATGDVGWNSFLTDVPTAPWYKGPAGSSALSSYNTYYKNTALQRIPVEGNYGTGTALSHWDNGSTPTSSMNRRNFNGVYHPAPVYELMTGFLSSSEYMTGLTAGFLKDYGYSVNLVCPYVVAYPFTSMPSAAFRVKCSCMAANSKILHTLNIEEMPPSVEMPIEMPVEMPVLYPTPNIPSLYDYLLGIGYYTPIYFE
jgi:hypothetical protein